MARRHGSGRGNKRESVTVTAARIGGRYLIAATVIGAFMTVAFTHGFGLLTHHSRQQSGVLGPPARIDSVTLDTSSQPTWGFVFARRVVLTPPQLVLLNRLSPNDPGYTSWFASRGGFAPVENYVKLVVEGNRPSPVRIIYMHVVDKCAQPLRGTYFLNSPAGGPGSNLTFQFDLDSPVPIPQLQYAPGNYFRTHTVVLKKGESETFEIGSWTSHHSCSYTLQMTVVDGAKTVVEKVSDHGRPFRVTALVSNYKVLYVGGKQPGVVAPFVRQNPARFGY